VSKYKVKKIVSTTIKKQFKSLQHTTSTSPIPFETDYKAGGTMTMCFGPCISCFHSKVEDPLGRWTSLSLNARNGLVVHFITVYQVVDKPLGGPYTAYQQQRASLLLDNQDLLPRQGYVCTVPTTERVTICHHGDFNEVVGRNATGFAKITSQYHLIDKLGHFHSVNTEVPTYARGTTRLDNVFCSPSLLPDFYTILVILMYLPCFLSHKSFAEQLSHKTPFGISREP
jgi:hypothetical protein